MITAQAGKRVAAYGDCSSAKTQTAASLARIPDGENRRFAALALAQCGDATAKKLIDAEAKARPAGLGGSGDIRAPDRGAK